MVNSERKSYENYSAAKLSAKKKRNQNRANAYAKFMKDDIEKGSIYYINLTFTETDIGQEYLKLASGRKILCHNKLKEKPKGIILVTSKQDAYYQYLATSEVIIVNDILSAYYINREGQYLGLDTKLFLEQTQDDYESKNKWLKTFIKADFLIAEDKELLKNKIKVFFGDNEGITQNIVTEEEFRKNYAEDTKKLERKVSQGSKKQLLIIHDFSENEKWFPLLHNYLQNIDYDEYQVIIIGDCKEFSAMTKYVETLDPRTRVIQTKGWAIIDQSKRMEYDYIFAELPYLDNYTEISNDIELEVFENEWKKIAGEIHPDKVICFEVFSWKWLYLAQYLKTEQKIIYFDADAYKEKCDSRYSDIAKANYYKLLSQFDRIVFKTKYDRVMVTEESGGYKELNLGQVQWNPVKKIDYWVTEAKYDGKNYLTYNDFWSENHFIDVVEKPKSERTCNYFVITETLETAYYEKFKNYITTHQDEDIYVFDFTKSYALAVQELMKECSHLKYYTYPLYYYLLLQYMDGMIQTQSDKDVFFEKENTGKNIIFI